MNVFNNILEAIGNTPIVKINKMLPDSQANVYAKLEYLNPGGSIKDRIAKHIINKAEQDSRLQAEGTIVENTSGNTGAGLAMVAAVKNYKAVFTIPDKMSSEKINFMKAFGAKVVVTPTNVPAESPQSYYETAKRIHQNTDNSFYVNQYHNPDNPEAHYKYTGPELWEQMDGKIDYFVAGIGTGGTLSGVAKFLKEKNPEIKVIAVDPIGSVFYDYFKHGKPGEPNVYKLEGIGEDMMVDAMDFNVVDDIYQVSDEDGFATCRSLARQEGIFGGGSSGAAVWGALQVAKNLPADKNIVTILPDTGFRYLSKVYNDEWMRDNGLIKNDNTSILGELIEKNPKKLTTTNSQALIKDVINTMKRENISQMPVIDDKKIIGLISESAILDYMLSSGSSSANTIAQLIQTHFTAVDYNVPVFKVLEILKAGENAVLVMKDDKLIDILTKIDLIDYLS
ncbi:MAG: pyridoxal-phosphate dependent enzyme [Calditrichaeota bacterium]|nr:MAG: pyridoxal-phosphate dependent enzyme [Calditrichota bacterium]MBL1204096.1 pyridoxal-phosphate dependent enzyme [Calditrichota bacterium]NOG43927.1 pyridoxal-phosphate dependent enzyme [Calditrichota bacterium]